MKKRTNKQKFNDFADAYDCLKEGKKVKRAHAKDGSIPTHPVVEVDNLPEKEVLKDCLSWFKIRGIFCDRNNVGGGCLSFYGEDGSRISGYHTYGIIGAGDIIGLLPNGTHFEVECKAGKGGRLSVRQQQRMENIHKNEGIYFVVHGVSELEHYFAGLI